MTEKQAIEQSEGNVLKYLKGTLQPIFNQKARLFNINIKPFQNIPNEMNLDSIHTDPAIAEITQGFHVYTDSFRDKVFTSELKERLTPLQDENYFSYLKALDAVSLKKELAQLQKTTDLFLNNLKAINPELHSIILKQVDTLSPRKSNLPTSQEIVRRNKQIIMLASQFQRGYFFTTLEEAITSSTNKISGEISKQESEIKNYPIALLPGSNFTIEEMLKNSPAYQEAKINPPGTVNDWAAFITAHEAEHRADMGQNTIDSYFRNKYSDFLNNFGPKSSSAREIALHAGPASNAKEIEADIGATFSLMGKINPQIPKYWAAIRMGDSIKAMLLYHISHEGDVLDKAIDIPKNYFISDTHNTGYFLAKYIETGIIPKFESAKPAVDGFHQKVSQRYEENAKAILIQSNMDTALTKKMGKISLAEISNLIQHMLTDTNSPFTDEEKEVAKTFIIYMNEQLGIQSGNYEDGLKKEIQGIKNNTEIDNPWITSDEKDLPI